MCECVPEDARGVEHRAVDTGSYEMWRAAASRSRQDDATVTPAETAAHDLFERDVASAAVCRCELGNGPHHGCRAARVQSYFLRPGRRSQRRLESRGDKSTRSPAAVFRCED